MTTARNTTDTAMRIKTFGYALIVLSMLPAMTMHAQLKQFTLEDLNFGGNNYYNMSPKNMYITWWATG